MKGYEGQTKLLQSQPFFGGISGDIISLILESSEVVSVSKGDFFFKEGDAAKAMYVLEAGLVDVLKKRGEKEFHLREMRQGDCFGEMALMDFRPRSASVFAKENCTAIKITPSTLLKISKADPAQFAMIEMNMGREVCRRLRDTEDHIFEQRVLAEAATKDQENESGSAGSQ